jgi:histone deacetylase complex regulatory component SIN3
VYPQFLDLLSEYRTPPRNVDKFRVQVKGLLKDEPDMLVRFEEFLPKERGELETVGHGQDDTT